VHWPESAPVHLPRTDMPAGLIDVAPTILDAVHVPIPPSFAGTSLMKFELAGMHQVVSESVYARDQFGWAPLRALRLGPWKLIDAPHPELYDLQKDPRERTNLIRSNSAEAGTLRAELAKLLARYAGIPAKPDTAGGTRKTLQSLGYLAGSARSGSPNRATDPKDKIAEYQLFERALDAFYAHRIDEAIADLRRVLVRDPANQPAAQALAEYQKIRVAK
jgi:hypothetical protein